MHHASHDVCIRLRFDCSTVVYYEQAEMQN